MIHLDTSFLIRALVPDSAESRRLRQWIRAGEGMTMSSIAWAEFLCGPLSAGAVEEAAELFGEPVPFDGLDATLAAEFFNAAGRKRRSMVDSMIAASACRRDARLATSNSIDFQSFGAFGLRLT